MRAQDLERVGEQLAEVQQLGEAGRCRGAVQPRRSGEGQGLRREPGERCRTLKLAPEVAVAELNGGRRGSLLKCAKGVAFSKRTHVALGDADDALERTRRGAYEQRAIQQRDADIGRRADAETGDLDAAVAVTLADALGEGAPPWFGPERALFESAPQRLI